MVRESQLPHMESLVPDVAVVGCRGRSAGKAHWERQVGPMCVTRGATVQRCRSSATSLRPRLWVMGEWGSLPRFLANKSCTTGPWNVLEPDLSGSVGLATGQQTLAETDRCWSGQGRACKTACNLSHHHHVLTKA